MHSLKTNMNFPCSSLSRTNTAMELENENAKFSTNPLTGNEVTLYLL